MASPAENEKVLRRAIALELPWSKEADDALAALRAQAEAGERAREELESAKRVVNEYANALADRGLL